MLICDLNCDMGEGAGSDGAIMPFISSANIACGFHAGNGETIRRTIALAQQYGVHIGAHPSFNDRENFGRSEMHLSGHKIYTIVMEQLIRIDLIAKEMGATLHHVKPHGALYNMAAGDRVMACAIAQAVQDFCEELVLYGLCNSFLTAEAKRLGLQTASEVFADRTYQDDGSLTPRSQQIALIETEEQCIRQVSQMVSEGTVTTISGKTIPVVAETICIHADTKNSQVLARKLHAVLQKSGSEIL